MKGQTKPMGCGPLRRTYSAAFWYAQGTPSLWMWAHTFFVSQLACRLATDYKLRLGVPRWHNLYFNDGASKGGMHNGGVNPLVLSKRITKIWKFRNFSKNHPTQNTQKSYAKHPTFSANIKKYASFARATHLHLLIKCAQNTKLFKTRHNVTHAKCTKISSNMPVSSSLQLRILRKCITFARTTQHFHRKVKIIFRISHKMLKISSEVYSFLQLLAISGQYFCELHERHNAPHAKS